MKTRMDECDVLVIGSGMGGVRAAIEARRAGLDTLIVDKSILARASATIFAGSIVARRPPEYLVKKGLIEPGMEFDRPFDESFRYFVKEGARTGGSEYIANQRVSMAVACDMEKRAEELRDFGVKDIFSQMWLGPVGRKGRDIILPMVDYAKKIGVRTRQMTMITDFIRQGDDIIGAIGFDILRGEFVTLRSKAIVMATGSHGQIYERSYAPIRMTGDGYASAYRAGAALSHMEMMGFDNWGIAEPGLPQYWLPPSLARISGVLRNARGEMFFMKYAQEHGIIGEGGTLSLNDTFSKRYGRPFIELIPHLIKACQTEIMEGRGDGAAVFIDLTQVPEERMYLDHNGVWTLNLLRGFDWKKRPIRIAPICMGDFKGGGVDIDEKGKTTTRGLFAAGDVAPGSSLLHALVTGVLAGRSAASRALYLQMPEVSSQTNDWIQHQQAQLKTILQRTSQDGPDPKDIKNRIKSVMWRCGGPLRQESSLREGIDSLAKVEGELAPKVAASGSFRKLREAMEALNMVTVGQMVLSASLYRTESRGYNQRVDYPNRDDKNWLKKTIITHEESKMKVRSEPVELVFISPEESMEKKQ